MLLLYQTLGILGEGGVTPPGSGGAGIMSSYLKQSTASQDRAIGVFIDDTDFKTLETGLSIASSRSRYSVKASIIRN